MFPSLNFNKNQEHFVPIKFFASSKLFCCSTSCQVTTSMNLYQTWIKLNRHHNMSKSLLQCCSSRRRVQLRLQNLNFYCETVSYHGSLLLVVPPLVVLSTLATTTTTLATTTLTTTLLCRLATLLRRPGCCVPVFHICNDNTQTHSKHRGTQRK